MEDLWQTPSPSQRCTCRRSTPRSPLAWREMIGESSQKPAFYRDDLLIYDHHWTIKIFPVQCSNVCHSNLPLDHGGWFIMSMDVYGIGFTTVTIVPTCSKPLMGELTMLTPFEDFLPRLDRKTLAIHGMILQVGDRVQHGDCLDSCASMTCQWCLWPTLDTNSPQTHELERLVWVKNILVTIQIIILACAWTNKFVKPIVKGPPRLPPGYLTMLLLLPVHQSYPICDFAWPYLLTNLGQHLNY